jgi:hypothetical protein
MTTTSHIELATSRRWSTRRTVESLTQAAVAAIAFALLAGAWLSFFMVVPFDFTIR